MKKKFDEINIIPFIDIMLVLLAIVLISASFISQGKIKVNLPKSETNQELKSQEIKKIIIVSADGKIYLEQEELSLDKLKKEIEIWDKNDVITLKVDAQTDFQNFVNIADILNNQEIKNVNIISQKNEKK